MVGVAANPNTSVATVLMSGLAGLIAGAMSMAVGEYVSVASQKDLEEADLEVERKELERNPSAELQELACLYEKRGVRKDTALEVATQLMEFNALEAHARDELGILDFTSPNPLTAAVASFICFLISGAVPFILTIIISHFTSDSLTIILSICAIALFLLATSGGFGAYVGRSSILKGALRVTIGGTFALFLTMIVGYLSQYILELLGYESVPIS